MSLCGPSRCSGLSLHHRSACVWSRCVFVFCECDLSAPLLVFIASCGVLISLCLVCCVAPVCRWFASFHSIVVFPVPPFASCSQQFVILSCYAFLMFVFVAVLCLHGDLSRLQPSFSLLVVRLLRCVSLLPFCGCFGSLLCLFCIVQSIQSVFLQVVCCRWFDVFTATFIFNF